TRLASPAAPRLSLDPVVALNFTNCAEGKSQGHGCESSVGSRNRAFMAPLMTSRTVFQGSVLPAFTDRAVAIDNPDVSLSFHASGRFSARISGAPMTAGGAQSLALAFSIPAGIDSPSILAGPESNHKSAASTAALIALSTT